MHPSIIRYDNLNKPKKIFSDPFLKPKIQHIDNMLFMFNNIYPQICEHIPNKILMEYCIRHHDNGFAEVYKKYGVLYDPSPRLHNLFSLAHFDSTFEYKPKLLFKDEKLNTVTIFRDALLYHGNPELCINSISIPYVTVLTILDELETAANIAYQIIENPKDNIYYTTFFKNTSNTDYQKAATETVMRKFCFDEDFSEADCETFADYILFIAKAFKNNSEYLSIPATFCSPKFSTLKVLYLDLQSSFLDEKTKKLLTV